MKRERLKREAIIPSNILSIALVIVKVRIIHLKTTQSVTIKQFNHKKSLRKFSSSNKPKLLLQIKINNKLRCKGIKKLEIKVIRGIKYLLRLRNLINNQSIIQGVGSSKMRV